MSFNFSRKQLIPSPQLTQTCLAFLFVWAGSAIADSSDQRFPILPPVPLTASTIPANGDVNPYGLAFIPAHFRTQGGSLSPGDLLVSNFNNSANSQGTGTTIVKVAPNGQTSLFFQGNTGLGLNPDPKQPSEVVEFTPAGKFVAQLSLDPAPGGAFGLALTNEDEDVLRFAAVDDNANNVSVWTLHVPDSQR